MHPNGIRPSAGTGWTLPDHDGPFSSEYAPSRAHLQGWDRLVPNMKIRDGGEAVIAARNQPPRVAARFSVRLHPPLIVQPMVSCYIGCGPGVQYAAQCAAQYAAQCARAGVPLSP